MTKKKYKHLFFDLDRTLWDFETNARLTFQELFVKHELQKRGVHDFDLFYENYTHINEGLWDQYRKGELTKEILRDLRFNKTLSTFGIDDSLLSEQLGKDYVAVSPTKSKMMDGAMEVIQYLHQKKYPLHIITNGFEEVQIIKMKSTKLDQYFENLITSERAGVKKPHPGIFELAMQESGAKASTSLIIGDDYNTDIIGAQSVGMDQVYYNPNKECDDDQQPTYFIKNLLELKEIL